MPDGEKGLFQFKAISNYTFFHKMKKIASLIRKYTLTSAMWSVLVNELTILFFLTQITFSNILSGHLYLSWSKLKGLDAFELSSDVLHFQ